MFRDAPTGTIVAGPTCIVCRNAQAHHLIAAAKCGLHIFGHPALQRRSCFAGHHRWLAEPDPGDRGHLHGILGTATRHCRYHAADDLALDFNISTNSPPAQAATFEQGLLCDGIRAHKWHQRLIKGTGQQILRQSSCRQDLGGNRALNGAQAGLPRSVLLFQLDQGRDR